MPVWPHPRYAEAYRASAWGRAGYGSIELTEFVEDVLPHLAQVGDEWYADWPK